MRKSHLKYKAYQVKTLLIKIQSKVLLQDFEDMTGRRGYFFLDRTKRGNDILSCITEWRGLSSSELLHVRLNFLRRSISDYSSKCKYCSE